MAGFIAQQPNGLYCRHSSVVDCITDYNMTFEDYVELIYERNPKLGMEYAKNEAEEVIEKHLRPFEWVKEYFGTNNMTNEEFEAILKEMGD